MNMPDRIRKIMAMVVLMLICAPCVEAVDKDNDDLLIVSSYSTQYNWSSRVLSKLESIVHAKRMTVSTLNVPLASVASEQGVDSLANIIVNVVKEIGRASCRERV